MDPQLLGSSALSTGNSMLDAILQGQFRSSGPAAGSGFSPGSMAGDIYGTTLNTPSEALGGAAATPSATTGTSVAKYVPPLTGEVEDGASKLLRLGGRLGAGSLGATVFAAPALQGPNAFGGDVDKQMASAKSADDADRAQFWNFWKHPFGPATADEVAPVATNPPTADEAAPVATNPPTQTQTKKERYPPVPPTTFGSPPSPPGHPRGLIPINPFGGGNVPYPPPRPKDRAGVIGRSRGGDGRGGGGGGAAPPMVNLQPQPGWTTIDRPNADIAGGRSVAGQLAPQYFNRAREPGGPAQMGVFDFSTLFHPQIAQAAAAHPAVQAAAGGGRRAAPVRRPVRGPLAPNALGGSGSPTPMDIQDQTRGMYPVTGSGSPTPMFIQDRTRAARPTRWNRDDAASLWPQGFL